jgi:pimeloyl-ACP methyl ester carboxylesterase
MGRRGWARGEVPVSRDGQRHVRAGLPALLDLLGWRGGRARASPATLEAVAAVAARWLEITDRRDVVLVGHSTGAQAALRAALLIPERVTGVVLAGPSFDPVTRSLPRSVLGAVATLPREPIGAAEVAVPSYLHSGGVQLLRFVRSALAYRCEDHLPELAAPVVLLTAEHDPFSSPAWVAEMARSVSAPWHVLAGAHMSQYSNPDATDKLVRETVRGWFGRARTKPESYTGSSS